MECSETFLRAINTLITTQRSMFQRFTNHRLINVRKTKNANEPPRRKPVRSRIFWMVVGDEFALREVRIFKNIALQEVNF